MMPCFPVVAARPSRAVGIGATRVQVPAGDPCAAAASPLSRVRVVTYRSLFPNPPARSEKKYSVVPSKESAGAPSNAVLLTVGPRLTGVDQGSRVVARVDTQMSWLP